MNNEERLRILQMVQEGKVSSEEGVELLKALDEVEPAAEKPVSPGKNRFLRMRVEVEDEVKVNMNVPMNLVKVLSKFAGVGMKYIPEDARREIEARGVDLSQIDFDELLEQVEQGLVDGKIVDIHVDEPGEKVKVEIYVE